jgi:hypothetical protein
MHVHAQLLKHADVIYDGSLFLLDQKKTSVDPSVSEKKTQALRPG